LSHRVIDLLYKFGLSHEGSLELYSKKVRDREDVSVFRCNKSGVIVLNKIDFGSPEVYEKKEGFEYWEQEPSVKEIKGDFSKADLNEDDLRRFNELLPIVKNKAWLDFGAGMGGCLRALKDIASNAHGLEIQPGPRDFLNGVGVSCYKDLAETEDSFYDVMTMFHVFEHLDMPIEILAKCHEKMKKQGLLIVEVPHSKDALLSVYESEGFKEFTLWSEHLILHTRESLKKFIEAAGFEVKKINNVQRYPLVNHLYWLAKNEPRGQVKWPFLNSETLNREYAKTLSDINATDTLVAYCTPN
jgi:predicted SAM-dependent methyltransferase